MLIYQIVNKINNKIYIGQTTRSNINRRISEHKYSIKDENKNTYLLNAFKKYGFENFEFSIIENNINTLEDLNDAEKYWIKWYDSISGIMHLFYLFILLSNC